MKWKEACLLMVSYINSHTDIPFDVQEYSEDVFYDWEMAFAVLDAFKKRKAAEERSLAISVLKAAKLVSTWDDGPFGHDLRTPEGRAAALNQVAEGAKPNV